MRMVTYFFEKLIDEETLDALRLETDRVVAEAAELTEHNASVRSRGLSLGFLTQGFVV